MGGFRGLGFLGICCWGCDLCDCLLMWIVDGFSFWVYGYDIDDRNKNIMGCALPPKI